MTRPTKSSLAVLAAVGYLFSPIVYISWLVLELNAGAFPVNGDSIGIPIAGFLFIWLVGLLLAAVVVIKLAYKKAVLDK
jgi:hypothetical protein